MTNVFLVMGNDYPEAVFAKREDAEDFCEQMRKSGTRVPRIYWRVYHFELREEKACSSR